MKDVTESENFPTFDLLGPSRSCLTVVLKGGWRSKHVEPEKLYESVIQAMSGDDVAALEGSARVEFDSAELLGWDSRLLVQIAALLKAGEERQFTVRADGLPEGMRSMLRLSRAVPPRGERRSGKGRVSVLELVGHSATASVESLGNMNTFVGEALLSLWRFVRGKARFQKSDIFAYIQATGPAALPIVGVLNVLLGVILGFMGSVQLQQFGAEIYVANLVALGQTREIAPMMTAIVMAGRTGAAYAAQLGTMSVNEEIDALRTFGFSPMDFLVLPRMVALALMFPILVLYADALGIFGGYIVGVAVLGISTTEYIEQTRQAIDMGDIFIGLVKGSIFGILVAITGCMKGMQSGRSASAVGDATTQAVVSGIIAIIVMTAVFAVLTNVLGL